MKNQNEEKGKSWKVWAAEVAIEAAIGAATGTFTVGAGFLAARAGTESAKAGGTHLSVWIAKAAIHGGAEVIASVLGSVVSTHASNAATNATERTNDNITASETLQDIADALLCTAVGKAFGKINLWKKSSKAGKGAKEVLKTGKVKNIVLKNNSFTRFRANGGKTIKNFLNNLKPASFENTFMRLDN